MDPVRGEAERVSGNPSLKLGNCRPGGSSVEIGNICLTVAPHMRILDQRRRRFRGGGASVVEALPMIHRRMFALATLLGLCTAMPSYAQLEVVEVTPGGPTYPGGSSNGPPPKGWVYFRYTYNKIYTCTFDVEAEVTPGVWQNISGGVGGGVPSGADGNNSRKSASLSYGPGKYRFKARFRYALDGPPPTQYTSEQETPYRTFAVDSAGKVTTP